MTSLLIKGHDSYKINDQGLVAARYNITNNYSEYRYNSQGLLINQKNKIHSPKSLYFERNVTYKKDGAVSKIHDKNFDTKEESTITTKSELQEFYQPFIKKEINEYSIDTTNRVIMTYKYDMLFCCGLKMKDKNRLLYYYNNNDLIDSLTITGLSSNKKMTYIYEYNK